MIPRRSLRLPSASAVLLASLLLMPGGAFAGDWVEYVDESSSRIAADTSVGLTDQEEKDIASGDVDKDGDTDLVIVRKVPFSNAGGRRNVLFMNESGKRLADAALDIMGPAGQLKPGCPHAPLGGRFERSYRYTVVDTIGGGASEIQKNIIATRGLGLPRNF